MDFHGSLNLLSKTAIISIMMAGLCSMPLWFSQIKKVSHLLFLVGTGALFGICFFDLIPDVYEMGGYQSISLVGAVWLFYSLAHYFHYRKIHIKTGHEECHGHRHEDEHHHVLLHADEKGIGVFLGSMMLHCFASGILLAISTRYGDLFSRTVFFALLTHKAYESLIVSSIILEKISSTPRAFAATFAYAVSFPVGVLAAFLLNDQISAQVALGATSVALGTLLGCMVFDFLLPTIQHVRRIPSHVLWVLIGLILTELIMKATH